MRAAVCPKPWGRECQTSKGGEGARRGALTTQPGAGFWTRDSALLLLLLLLLPSWRWRPRLPAHMPRPRSAPARAGRGAGRGTPPAVGRGLAPDSGPPGCAPSDRPQSRAESSVPAGRRPPRARPLSALRPLPSALCCGRLPAFRGPALDSPGRGARPPPPSSPARSPRAGSIPNGASSADRCAQPQTRSAARGAGARTRTHTLQFQAGTGSRALAAGGCEATPQLRRRKKEGDRERAGGGGGRKGGETEEEGGTESSLLLPAARSILASTAGNLWWKGER